jgi:hypothetical protein
MSFLHDYETYSKIISDAFYKKAQQKNILDPVQVAKKLVARLSREMGGASEEPNISAATPAGLSTVNLQNIGNLLKFLDESQIRVDGVRAVYDQAESETLPQDEQDKLSPVTINVSRDAATRKWNTADYYTNLPVLIKYVSYLQNKSKTEDNKVLSVMVGKLIDQINTIKPDSGLSRAPKSVPGKIVNELPDDTQIDGFGTKVFDSKNLSTDSGSNMLFAKDLKNRETLNAWMLTNPEAQIVTYDANGKKISAIKYSDEKADRCVIVNVLFNRAKNLLQSRATSPEDTKKYNFYIKKMQELGQTFVGPDGQSCMVGGSYHANSGGDTTLTGYHPDSTENGTGGSAGRSGVDDQTIRNIVSTFPLAISEINTDKIYDFINQVKVLGSGTRGARLQSYIADLTTKITAFQNLTTHKDAIVSMNTTPAFFAGTLRNVQNYIPALSLLENIVSLTRQILSEFNSAYGNKLDDNERTNLLGQIGRNTTDNSIFMRNMEDLESLKQKVNQVLRVTNG